MMLRRLQELRPDLHAELSRRVAECCAPGSQRPLAVRLRMDAARQGLEALHGQGVRRLAVAGSGPFLDDLCAAGLLDRFQIACIAGRDPGSLIAPDRSILAVTPPDAAGARGCDGVLVLDTEAMPRQWRGVRQAAVPEILPGTLPFSLPETLRGGYEAWLAAVIEDMQAKIEALGPSHEVVLFTGVYAYFNFNRLSVSLRRQGCRTVFLCLNPSNQAFRGEHFDLCLHAHGDFNVFYWLMAAFPYRAVHYQGWLNMHLFALAARTLVSSPFVVEFNDLLSMLFDEEEFDRLFGAGAAKADQACVDELVRDSEGLVFNYAAGAAGMLVPRNSPPFRHFHSWPLPEFFAAEEARPGPVRLAFTGTVNASHFPDPAFGDVKLLRLARVLAAQGIELHLFLNPYQPLSPRGVFWDYQYLAQQEPLFHIRQGRPPEELPAAIADMHYGAMIYLFPDEFTVKDEHFAHMMPTKFFSYMEAGLPVLVGAELESLAALVREHGLGAVLRQEDIRDIGRVLRGLDLPALRENVRRFRASHGMHEKLQEIESLYAEAKARRNKDAA